MRADLIAFRTEHLAPLKHVYYTLGQGFKVAAEVVIMAVAGGGP